MKAFETAVDELTPDDGTGNPATPEAFTHWPVPVGRVETRDGLTFVYSAEPGGFTVEDYRRIPGDEIIELIDGVAVVIPTPTPAHRRAVRSLYHVLDRVCPKGFVPYIGPIGIPISRSTVLAPDAQVMPTRRGPWPLVAEVLSDHGRVYDRRVKPRKYQRGRVASYWVFDPDAVSLTILELARDGYHETGLYTGDQVCTLTRPFPARFRVSDLLRP
jgi:Uma2 family endonuclease